MTKATIQLESGTVLTGKIQCIEGIDLFVGKDAEGSNYTGGVWSVVCPLTNLPINKYPKMTRKEAVEFATKMLQKVGVTGYKLAVEKAKVRISEKE